MESKKPKKPTESEDNISTMLDLDQHAPAQPHKSGEKEEPEEESLEELLKQQRSLMKRLGIRDLFKKNKT